MRTVRPLLPAALLVLTLTTGSAVAYFPSDFAPKSGAAVSTSSKPTTLQPIGPRYTKAYFDEHKTDVRSAQQTEQSLEDCMAEAAIKREAAIQEGWEYVYDRMHDILTYRQSLIQKAWSQSDGLQRDRALRTVWKSFGQSWAKARTDLRDRTQAAWQQYRTDRSACGVFGADPEHGGLGLDSQF